jgi:DNA-binding MarR family transcriptional regulator
MNNKAKRRGDLVEDILGRLVRRHSSATVLLHAAIAEALGIEATDHKCLDLVREGRARTATDLASITGLTTGAITGVVARLERAGFLRRDPDPRDGRRQILHVVQGRMKAVHEVFGPLHAELAAFLDELDAPGLAAIAAFLDRATGIAYAHMARVRARVLDARIDGPDLRERARPRSRSRRPGR